MHLLFNTIMIEINRWAADKTPSLPLADLLPAVAAADFTELELWQYHVSSLDETGLRRLEEALETHKISTPALGAYPTLHLDGIEAETEQIQLDALVDLAARLKTTTFKIFPGRLASAKIGGARALTVERLHRLAGRLAAHGMDLTLETHGNTLCDTLDSTATLLDELSACQNVGLCFQPYTDQNTDAALAAFDRFGDRIGHIHLQNRGTDSSCTLLAEGDWIDYTRFLGHVRRRGFDGLLCLEFTAGLFPPEGTPFDPQTVIDNAVLDRGFVFECW
jgi:sugar phosphate isomerase/epimerase